MSRRHRSFTPGLRSFLTMVMTPAVLVLGVLFLIYFNFSAVLKASQVNDDQFQGLVSFSQGNFAYRFQETAGIDRPALRFNGINMLSYAEWSSTVSVAGNVQELWNNAHGYDVDSNKRQVYSTISGDGWQLTKIISLVNDHTVTVAFQFVARPVSLPGPASYVFDIAHVVTSPEEWYNIQTNRTTFTASVLQADGMPTPTSSSFMNYGTLSLSATGPALHTPAIQLENSTTYAASKGSLTLGQAFYTEYHVTKPTPFEMIPLGTETLTFKPAQTPSDAPSQDVVPLPGT